ncbi:hypothetical protein L1987_43499 [Smallanthus sonchifolius]|uniref:Uncharacterized protein n=1 Tax=Smallanthus sonchifolius TaxID=185202 RepID=A0ACB9GN25_9ASTR|nr:hypothetical protein L1987_43499 [Smallanthus sonchifolius]
MDCMVQSFLFPALASLMLTAFTLYKIFPPETKHTMYAHILAKNKPKQIGLVKRNEWIMLGTMLVTVTLWISGFSRRVADCPHSATDTLAL